MIEINSNSKNDDDDNKNDNGDEKNNNDNEEDLDEMISDIIQIKIGMNIYLKENI